MSATLKPVTGLNFGWFSILAGFRNTSRSEGTASCSKLTLFKRQDLMGPDAIEGRKISQATFTWPYCLSYSSSMGLLSLNLFEVLSLSLALLGVLAAAGFFKSAKIKKNELIYAAQERDNLKKRLRKLQTQYDESSSDVFRKKIREKKEKFDFEGAEQVANEFFEYLSPAISEAAIAVADGHIRNENEDGRIALEEAIRILSLGLSADPQNATMGEMRRQLVAKIESGPENGGSMIKFAGKLNILQLNQIDQRLNSEGLFVSLVPIRQRIVELIVREYGRHCDLFVRGASNLGTAYLSTGRLNEAKEILIRAVATRRTLAEAYKAGDGKVFDNLAKAYMSLGELDDAEKLILEAIEIDKKTIDLMSLDFAIRLSNYSSILGKKGDFDGSLTTQLESYEIFEKLTGPCSVQSMRSKYQLAIRYAQLGDSKKSKELFSESLSFAIGSEALMDREFKNAADEWTAEILIFQKRFSDAELIINRALEKSARTFGTSAPEYLRNLKLLEKLYITTSRLEDARKVAEMLTESQEMPLGTVT